MLIQALTIIMLCLGGLTGLGLCAYLLYLRMSRQ